MREPIRSIGRNIPPGTPEELQMRVNKNFTIKNNSKSIYGKLLLNKLSAREYPTPRYFVYIIPMAKAIKKIKKIFITGWIPMALYPFLKDIDALVKTIPRTAEITARIIIVG